MNIEQAEIKKDLGLLLRHLQKNCQRRGQLEEVGVKQEVNKNDPVSRPANIKTELSESFTETEFPLLLTDSFSEPKSLTLDLSAEEYNSLPEEQMWEMVCQYVNFGTDLSLPQNYPNYDKQSQCKSKIFAKITSKKGASKSFVCHYCAKVFARKDIRDKHIRIHTGDRPFQCSACHKSFIQEAHLKEHQLLHTGEKPYQCSYCGKAFTKRNHMKDHERAHTGEKPHKCKNCDFRSAQRSNLNKHEKICLR